MPRTINYGTLEDLDHLQPSDDELAEIEACETWDSDDVADDFPRFTLTERPLADEILRAGVVYRRES